LIDISSINIINEDINNKEINLTDKPNEDSVCQENIEILLSGKYFFIFFILLVLQMSFVLNIASKT